MYRKQEQVLLQVIQKVVDQLDPPRRPSVWTHLGPGTLRPYTHTVHYRNSGLQEYSYIGDSRRTRRVPVEGSGLCCPTVRTYTDGRVGCSIRPIMHMSSGIFETLLYLLSITTDCTRSLPLQRHTVTLPIHPQTSHPVSSGIHGPISCSHSNSLQTLSRSRAD